MMVQSKAMAEQIYEVAGRCDFSGFSEPVDFQAPAHRFEGGGGNVVDLMEATRGGTVACGGSIKMDAADRIKLR